jgi:hypothetical protein
MIIHELKERERGLIKDLNKGPSTVAYQSPRSNNSIKRFKQYQVPG